MTTLRQQLSTTQRKLDEQYAVINHMMVELASQAPMDPLVLTENATHILANISMTAREGKPLTIMHPNSVASFLAGIEAISHALPTTTDPIKKDNTLRVLATAAVGTDGEVNYAVTPIAQLGARKPESLKKYQRLVQGYVMSVEMGKPDGKNLSHITDVLRQLIDQAMRRSTSQNVKGGVSK